MSRTLPSTFIGTLAFIALLLNACTDESPANPGPQAGELDAGDAARPPLGERREAPEGVLSNALPAWSVKEGFMRDRWGRALILRGVNISQLNKRPPYFGFHELPDYRRLRDEWGMNAVRYIISWAAISPNQGEVDGAYLDEVVQRVDWAHQAGLLVILDMHQDVFGEGFGGNGAPLWACDSSHYDAFVPTSPWFMNYLNEHVIACFDNFWASVPLQTHYAAAWKAVAKRLAAHPAVIGFDIMNEPYIGSRDPATFEPEDLQPFYDRVVAAVREVQPGWLVFMEPSSTRNLGLPTRLQPPSYPGVVYAPHAYEASAESGDGFDPARRSAVIGNHASLSAEAKSLGAAFWVGEYGGNADHPGIVEYMDAHYDGIGAVAGSSMYWAYDRDNGYGLLRPDGSEKAQLLDVVVRPYPERIAGDPIDYSYAEGTGVFELRWKPFPWSSMPTIISVPKRAYPTGFEVECSGCSFTVDAKSVRVDSAPTGDPAQLRIVPR